MTPLCTAGVDLDHVVLEKEDAELDAFGLVSILDGLQKVPFQIGAELNELVDLPCGPTGPLENEENEKADVLGASLVRILQDKCFFPYEVSQRPGG